MVNIIELKLEDALELLKVSEDQVSSVHNQGEFNLEEIKDNEAVLRTSNIFKGRAKDVVIQNEDSEQTEIAKTMVGALDMISHARVLGKSIDISAMKYVSALNNTSDYVVLSIRMTSNPDTRAGVKVGMATRNRDGSKAKELPQTVVVVTGLSDTQQMILERLITLSTFVRNIILGTSYKSLSVESAKAMYLNNLQYRTAKEIIYNGRIRNNSEDLSKHSELLKGAYVYQDIGEHSLDLSIYSTYSTSSLDNESFFGNVMENEAGLKKIKEIELGEGSRIYTRTCPDLVQPLKANYTSDIKDQVIKIASDIQVLQILVLNCIAVEEASYLEIKDVSFNEKKVLEILDENIKIVSDNPLSQTSGIEKVIQVSESDKIDAKLEAVKKTQNVMERDDMKDFKGMR